jgi:hypothetical protein
LLLGSVGAMAQGRGFGGPGFGGPGSGGPGFGRGGKVVTGEPYTAASTSSSVDTLSDGTTITHSGTSTEARDAEGRTVTSFTTAGASGKVTHTTVFDPVAHTVTSWSTGSTVATQFQLPANPPGGHGHEDGPGPGGPKPGGAGGRGGVKPTVTTVQLSPKSIAGDSATGVKTTITIAAGADGNDKPLVSTREVWKSTDLGILLEEISVSPREGSHTFQVTSLTQGTPDAMLFQVPQGYTVRVESRHRGE